MTAETTRPAPGIDGRFLKQAAYVVVVLILLALTLQSAVALSITDVQAPAAFPEGGTLHLSFSTDTPASYHILRDGVQVAAADTYDRAISYDDAGVSVYTFEATDGTDTVSENRTVEIVDVPLTITVREPDQRTTRSTTSRSCSRPASPPTSATSPRARRHTHCSS